MGPRRSGSRTRRRLGSPLVIHVCVVTLLMKAGEGIVGPVLPLYAADLGLGLASIGGVVGAAGLARIMVSFPAGWLSDSTGRQPLLVAGTILTAAGALGASISESAWQLAGVRFLAGLGNGLFMTGSIILLGSLPDPRERDGAIRIYQATIMAGVTVGPVVGGFVAGWAGFRAPFLFVAALAVLAAVWSAALVHDVKGAKEDEGGSELPASFGAQLGSALRNADLLLVSLVSFNIFVIFIGARQSIIPLLATSRFGLTPAALGGIFALISTCNLIATLPTGWLARRLGRKSVIVASGLISMASLFLFAVSPGVGLFVVAAILMGIGTGLTSPLAATYALETAPVRARGIAMGLYQTLGECGFVVGPVLLTWVAQIGGFNGALLVNAVIAAAASVVFGAFARETLARPPRPEPVALARNTPG
jgi:DHA1 family multidrug resistance protein-like MFS transporter